MGQILASVCCARQIKHIDIKKVANNHVTDISERCQKVLLFFLLFFTLFIIFMRFLRNYCRYRHSYGPQMCPLGVTRVTKPKLKIRTNFCRKIDIWLQSRHLANENKNKCMGLVYSANETSV